MSRSSRQYKRLRSPVGRGGRNPLIFPVREPALEVRLNRNGSTLDVPRPVLELRLQQKPHASFVSRVRRRDPASFSQCHQGLPGRVRIAPKRRKLGPAAISMLLANKLAHTSLYYVVVGLHTCPFQTEKLKHAVLPRYRLCLHQPLRGAPDNRVILRSLSLRTIDLNGPQCSCGDLKLVCSHRWAMRCHSPSPFGSLLQSDESRKRVGCGVRRMILCCHSHQQLTHGARLSANADSLPRTLLPL